MKNYVLPGVYCEAKDCKYNQGEKKCVAPAITVIGEQAKITNETACDTFVKQ